jgi:hypothetical protein
MGTYIGRSCPVQLIDDYSEKWTLYNCTKNNEWESVIIVDAKPDALIEITMINNSGQNDIGVRAVGSSLERHAVSIANSATTLIVRTNSNKEVQFFSSDFTDTDFYFSSQL